MSLVAAFTASNGTNLASYTPDAGGSFTEHSSFSSGDFAIQSNRAYPGASESVFYHSATIDRTMSVAALVRVISTGAGYAGVWAGVTGSNSCYVAYLYAPTGEWAFGKYVSGSWTALGTWADSGITTGSERTVQMTLTSTQVIFKVNGTTRGTFSDTSVTPTRAGVYGGGSSSTTGVHIDSLSVGAVPAATGTVYSSGTHVGVACGSDKNARSVLAYDHPNTTDEVSLLKVERSANNSTWVDVTSSVTVTALGSNDFQVVDPRPQYGSQSVSFGGTIYYRVTPGNDTGYASSASSAASLVSDVDKAAVRAASYAITSAYMAGHGGVVPSAVGVSSVYPGEALLTMALAYYETGTAQYLTDAVAQADYIVSLLDANAIIHFPDYGLGYTNRDHHSRTAAQVALASRLLRYAGALTDAADCLATANSMAKGWLDSVNSGNPTTSHTYGGWNAANQTAWASATSYPAGAIVRKTTSNGRTYRAMNAGTSGASEPTWPTSTGGTVTDNDITWKETSYTGQCSSQTYDDTPPYTSTGFNVVDPNQNASEAAMFSLLCTDAGSDFYAAGTYRTKALTAITDAVGLCCAAQASDGAITLGEAWTATDPGSKDTLYAGYTLAQLAIVRHLMGDVLPELPLFLSRGLNWLETRSGGSTEPITAIRYTGDTVPGFSELYFRAVGARALQTTSAADKLPYSAAFIDTAAPGAGEYGAYSVTGAVTSFGSGYQSIWDAEAYIRASSVHEVTLTPAEETDAAVNPGVTKHVTLTPATETSSPVALTVSKRATLTPATETDAAVALSITTGPTSQEVTLTPATESDAAQALSVAKVVTFTPATETDTARALTVRKLVTFTPATEVDVAVALDLGGALTGRAIPLPATADFVSARSQTADFASAKSQSADFAGNQGHTADFIAGPT